MQKGHELTSFDWHLQLAAEELTWEPGGIECLEVAEDFSYLINPRRLRGSDFLMRWSQGRWSEEIVARALNHTRQFGVLPYGPSTVAPDEPAALEHFFEKMDGNAPAGFGYRKKPADRLRHGLPPITTINRGPRCSVR